MHNSYLCYSDYNEAFKFLNASLLKKTIEPCQKHNRKCNGLMVIMRIVLVLMETIMVSTGM